MAVGAVLAAFLAVLVGTIMLADVTGPDATTPPRRVLGAHVGLALVSLVAVGAGAAVADSAVSWAGVALVAGTIGFGLTGLRHTLATPDAKRPSSAVLAVHGAAALVTLVLAILAAVAP